MGRGANTTAALPVLQEMRLLSLFNLLLLPLLEREVTILCRYAGSLALQLLAEPCVTESGGIWACHVLVARYAKEV